MQFRGSSVDSQKITKTAKKVKRQSVDARSPRGLGKPPLEHPKKTQEELMMEEMMNDDLLNVFKTEEVSGI